jgi:hypothetical protein
VVRKARPADDEAQRKIKDLAADDTIARGQYSGAAKPATGTKPTAGAKPPSGEIAKEGAPAEDAQAGPVLPRRVADPGERAAREIAQLKTRIEADPTNIAGYLQLAAIHRRNGHLEMCRNALTQGLGPTGNAFELGIELADLDIEPFRRDLAVTEEKLKAEPDNEELAKLRDAHRKEIATRELDLYRKKAERYPTEMVHRYEMGARLVRLGQVDEAIRELQASRADPRHRWQSLMQLGHCFKSRNNWRLAQRNYEEALQALPGGDMENRKELLYELAQGCAGAGDLSHALDLAHELANLDYTYRDINRRLEEWEAAASR